MKAACGKMPTDAELGSQPTLSPLENSVTQEDLHRIGQWFVDLYIRHNWKHKPKRIIIDGDSPDDPTYGVSSSPFSTATMTKKYMCHPLLVYAADTGEMISVALRVDNRHASYEIVSVLKFEKNRFVEIH